MVRRKVELIRGNDNMPVSAYLVNLAPKRVEDYHNLWREQLRLFKQEDKYWDWLLKMRFYLSMENYEGYAIEYFNQTQGLMMVETQMHGSQITFGKRLVYVESISSAPWNRRYIQHPPEFKRVGTVLLKYATIRSVELGYEGRVGLHSFPSAERFYDKQNMRNLGEDEDYDNLIYFEYGPLRQF